MTSIKNISSKPVQVQTSNSSFTIQPGNAAEVDVSSVQNLPEIRRNIVVGQDLSEIKGRIGSNPIRG